MNKLKTLSLSILIGSFAGAVASFAFSSPGTNQPPNGNPTFWLLNGTNMYYSGGNVGIGTSTPAWKLQILGGATQLFLGTTDFINGSTGSALYMGTYGSSGNVFSQIQAVNTGNTAATNLLLNPNGGSIGVGTTTPGTGTANVGEKLDIEGGYMRLGYTGGPFLNFYQSTAGTDLKFTRIGSAGGDMYFDSINDAYTTPATRLFIQHTTGNVGIGTTAPGEKLEVNGNIKFTSDGSIISKAPRAIHSTDPRVGCPASWPANTAFWTSSFTLSRTSTIFVSGDIIRQTSGRADLALVVDASQVNQQITNTGGTLDWLGGNVEWSGVLSPGTHSAYMSSPSANIWGCGAGWGSMDILIFEN